MSAGARKLTVLLVAYPFAPVGRDAVGGAEQVVAALDRGLTQAGHRSIVLALRGSSVDGTLVPLDIPPSRIGRDLRDRIYDRVRDSIASLVERQPIDLVHYHGYDFCQYLPPAGVTMLATLHLPISFYHPVVFRLGRPRTYLHCVSRSQRAGCPECEHLLPEIPNGVPVSELGPPARKRSFALFLGRICPEKNVHAALDAGRVAGVPVLVGGKVFPYETHQRYFDDEVRPRLDRLRRFLGPLGFRAKRRLLSAARCLLVTSVAPETSCLVAMEALASGTPVIAFRTGALPELIEHGTTGFLVEDEREMAAAIHDAADLDAEACKRAARERFSLDRMLAAYFRAYRGLSAARRGGDLATARIVAPSPRRTPRTAPRPSAGWCGGVSRRTIPA